MDEKQKRADKVYELTEGVATSAMWAEGLSGVIGFGVPLLVDGAVLIAYSDLWNDVRAVYGKGKITAHAAREYLKPNIGFLVQDFVFDTVLGNIPIIGIPFNVAFAKATTWRLGAWFGVLAALGDDRAGAGDEQVSLASMDLVRKLFPATSSVFDFTAPDRKRFVALVSSLDGLTPKIAEQRVEKALEALSGEGR